MTEILSINPQNPEPDLVMRVCAQLNRGEVVIMPTDTVYGMAANPFVLSAVDRVYGLKGRSRRKALSLLVSGIAQAEELSRNLPPEFYKLAEAFWPGPLTLIVEAGTTLPLKVTANTGHVAMRHPLAPIPVAVSLEAGYPLIGTSANLSGERECLNAAEALTQFADVVPIIVDGGPARSAVPSTIVDLTSNPARVIREGVIPITALDGFLPGVDVS